jgi:hypothetical protein
LNKEQLIDKLKTLETPTRANMRKAGVLDSVWEKEFGSWTAFVRSSGLTDNHYSTRIKAMFSKIAQPSQESLKATEEKKTWDKGYVKPNTSRFQTILSGADIHDTLCDPFYRRLFVDTAKRVQPSKIILNGDTFEMFEFSKYTKDPRKMNILGSIKWVQNFLKELREVSPSSEIIMIEGNHECVSLDTDLLTENGFMNCVEYLKVADKVKVASFDGSKVNFSIPLASRLIPDKHIISLKSSMTEEKVSSKHNVYVKGKLIPAMRAHGSIIKDFTYKVDSQTNLDKRSSEEWRLIASILAESELLYEEQSSTIKEIRWTFESDNERLSVKGENAVEVMVKLGLEGKKLPKNFLQISKTNLEVFLEELRIITSDSIPTFNATLSALDKDSADQIQAACFLNNIATQVTECRGETPNSDKLYNLTYYYDTQTLPESIGSEPVNIKLLDEVEDTVAVQTEDGTLITRLNGKVQVTGNCRLIKFITETNPNLVPILSDIHGMDFASLVGLKEYGIRYIGKVSLAYHSETNLKREVAKNYYLSDEAILFHHFPYAKEWGFAGVNGHHHKHIVTHHYNALRGPYEWHQLGAGHIRQAEYCEGEVWQNGFILCHVDTHKKYTQFEYVDCTGEHCVIGGKWYNREEDEIVKVFPK